MTATEAWISNQSKGVRFRNWFVVLEGIFLDRISIPAGFFFTYGHRNKVSSA